MRSTCTRPAPAAPAPPAAAKPRMFALVAGVNDYADKRIRLSYAVSDAREVARGFKEAGGSLYSSIEIRLATDAEVTRDKLDAAFADIAGKAQPSDVFVLYLAGHGKTVDGRYYFIPQDFVVDGELNEKSIGEAVKVKAIAQEQWQRWFASIPARKSVILFDTCDSGTLTGDASETQQLERGAANDRLAQATGRSILTASGGSEEALEGYRGHGLFTYELLEAIAQADGDNNGTVELTELAAYVYGQVAELSLKVFKQRQVPQMKITSNYPLARQTRILMDEVTPIAEAKPTFQVSQATQLQIQPSAGGTVVRSLSATTRLTVLDSKNGWSLVASEGKPIGYVATTDLAPAIREARAVFIAVGTPSLPDGNADLSYVRQAAESIAQEMNGNFLVVVNKSTVPIGSGNWVGSLIKESYEKRVGSSEGAITGWSFCEPIPVINKITAAGKAVLTPVPSIYQAGQWTYSPAGVPMSILTGKLAAQRILSS